MNITEILTQAQQSSDAVTDLLIELAQQNKEVSATAQHMTAEETAALQASAEIQAITFAPQLLEAMHAIQGDSALSASLPGQSGEIPPIVIENTFHIEGNATPETIAALEAYGDSLKDVVKEALEEISENAARTAYR